MTSPPPVAHIGMEPVADLRTAIEVPVRGVSREAPDSFNDVRGLARHEASTSCAETPVIGYEDGQIAALRKQGRRRRSMNSIAASYVY